MGHRIAALRREAGWSQSELARRLGVSASAVGMYEQGRREPAADMLVQMGKVFGVTVDYLLTGQDPAQSRELERLIRSRIAAADTRLGKRADRPFSRDELAVLFAAMLLGE